MLFESKSVTQTSGTDCKATHAQDMLPNIQGHDTFMDGMQKQMKLVQSPVNKIKSSQDSMRKSFERGRKLETLQTKMEKVEQHAAGDAVLDSDGSTSQTTQNIVTVVTIMEI